MTFKQRIQITFLILAVLALGGAFVSIRAAAKNFAGLQDMVGNDIPNLARAQEMKVGAKDLRRFEKDMFLNIGAPDKQRGYLEKWSEALAIVRADVDSLETHWVDEAEQGDVGDEVKKRLVLVRKALTGYEEGFKPLAELAMEDSTLTSQVANKKMNPFKEHIYTFESEMDSLADLAMNHIRASAVLNQDRVRQAGWVNGVVVLLFLVGTVLSGGWLMRVFHVNYARLACTM